MAGIQLATEKANSYNQEFQFNLRSLEGANEKKRVYFSLSNNFSSVFMP